MTTLLIATSNPGKIAELRDLLGVDVDVVTLDDLGIESPEETGATFTENAVLKATHAARRGGLVTLADDSGIEVDALGGAPGVHSARWAGAKAGNGANRKKLLQKLADVDADNRTARFVCVIAVARPNGDVRTFHGTLEGRVAGGSRGSGGFGYDSLLELPDGRTVAELTPDEKNRISHRARALAASLSYVRSLLGQPAHSTEGAP